MAPRTRTHRYEGQCAGVQSSAGTAARRADSSISVGLSIPLPKKGNTGSTGIRTQIGGFRVHSDNQLHYGAGHPEAMARIYKTRVASPRALVLSKCKCKCGWLALYYSANAWERACANAHGSRWPRPRPPEPSGSHREGGRDISFQNAMPTVGLEPTTTRLRVLRSAN